MKPLAHLLQLLASAQNRLCSWSMVVLGLVMTGTILIQIFFRFVIYRPVPWSEELARYLMVWMGMLGSVIALRQGRHIGVTFLVERLYGRQRAAVVRLVQLTLLGFLAIIGWEGWGLALFNAQQLSAAMEIPMSIPYLAIPAGAALMMVELAAQMLPTRDAGADGEPSGHPQPREE
jgi:TRAP-type C4-dicarboxylate transport system permease small subunit